MSEVPKLNISSDSSFDSTMSMVIYQETEPEVVAVEAEQRQLRGGRQYLLTTPVKKHRQRWESVGAVKQLQMASSNQPLTTAVTPQDFQQMMDTMQQMAIAMQALAGRPVAPVIVSTPAPARPGGVMGRAQLPIFDGTMDPDWHIEIYENIARMEKWDDQQCCSTFYRTLRKSAEAWHIQNSKVLECGTWPDMRALFLKQYRATDFEMKQQVDAVRWKQGEKESVYEYMEDKSLLWRRVDPGITNKLLLGHIYMDSLPDIRSRSTGFKPSSYEELLGLCVEIESDRKEMRAIWEARKFS